MVSELRKNKYFHVFDSYLDNNKDGFIDKKDFELIINKISQLRKWNSDDPRRKNVEETWYAMFDYLIQELDTNKDGRISREEWAVLYDKYAKNPSNSPKWQTLYENFVYEYLNPNGKPGITKEDYIEVQTFYGFPIDKVSAAFDRMSKGKEYIHKTEFKRLWDEYFTSDDPAAVGNEIASFNL